MSATFVGCATYLEPTAGQSSHLNWCPKHCNRIFLIFYAIAPVVHSIELHHYFHKVRSFVYYNVFVGNDKL